MKKISSLLIGYFFQGLLIVMPIAATAYLLFSIFVWLDNLLNLNTKGLGVLVIIFGLVLLGFLGSTFIIKPLFLVIEKILNRLPFVKIIYSSLKDLVSAFVGDKQKFNQAVLVRLNQESEIYKLGFITRSDLSNIGISDKMAVYLPHSYNFSGDLFVVPSQNVTFLDAPASEIMKFVVSGGVSGFLDTEV